LLCLLRYALTALLGNSILAGRPARRYGAQTPQLFSPEEVQWGGMTADTAIYLQSSLDISDVQTKSDGHWRIFSKLGRKALSTSIVTA
jgi:hypothetical protein